MKRAWVVAGWALAAALLIVVTGAGCGGKAMPHPDGGDGSTQDAIDARPMEGGGSDVPLDVPADRACATTGAPKSPGTPCDCASECASGFCADGVCCETACTEGCQTCAATGSVGTCTNLATGAAPVTAVGAGTKTTCAATGSSTCGLDGKCDGAGACREWPMGTPCKGGSCDGDAVVGGFACNGTGQCKPGATVICVPYTCDAQTGKCFDGCTTATQCVSGQACTNGSCGKRMKGATCHVDNDCASGFCADGVCCNVACKGPCVACNQLLRQGTCWPIEAGYPDPRAICVDEGKPSCGHTGTCDGVGGCARYAQDTTCEAPSCAGNKLNTARTCDGLGTCLQSGVNTCHPFRCVNGGCTNTCQTNADCDTGIACVNGTCGPKLTGQTCDTAAECASNFCVDRVCCENACSGACLSCALPSSPGRCVAVAAGNTDPRGVCQDEKATSPCGNNGRCDGSGSCQKYPVGTQCADESCASNVYTPPSTCNASGQCVAPDALPCRPYVCNGSKCFNACTTDAQCLKPPNSCVLNSCGLKDDGASCTAASECSSNFCEQGICCHTACGGSCRSCALAGTLGACTNVVTGSADPAGLCVDMGPMSCGTNGKCQAGACQKYTAGTSCKDPTCPAGTSISTAGSACDGAGACITPGSISCFPYRCGASSCKNTCAADADCASPAVCINGSCGLKPKGLPCSDLSECQSGFCAQGFCCESACTDKCKSCGLTGSQGTCTNVANGKADPKQSCADMGPASCSTDGFCDGNGGCRLYDATTSCASPTCPSPTSTATSGRTCDGRGVCQPATTISCAPYVCNGTTACKAACTSDADCLTPNICDPQTNLCGNKRRLGQSCSATSDCLTGASCVDGVCCSSSACGTCQVCNVAGSAGNCTNVALGVTEPHGLCTANPPCGNTGACNGAGACQQAATGVSCGTASCTGSTYTPISHCNGTGACAAPTASSCGNYVCGGGVCKTTCTADADCVAPNTCQGGNCARKPNGLACASASQCISGFCTDGVCCGSSTCPSCQACNVNGLGSCAALPAGTPAPGAQCPAGPPCGNTGACNGASACQQAATTVSCGTASCTGSTFTPVSHCNGSGACATPSTSTCAPYVCGTNACRADCSADADCVSGYYCTGTNGTCMAKKASGAACGAAHECGTGNCTDGFCCGVASCPTCQACGSSGMCGNLADGAADARCTAAPPCGNTGACDGAGACRLAATTVACGTASCSGSTFTPVSHCNGSGSCAAPTTSSCAPYVCGTNACNSSCSADTGCTSGYYCTGTNGSCVPKKASGAACGAAHECGTGNCTDGFCCGVASCPTCQVCGSSGMCTNVGSGAAEPHARCTASPPCGNTGACDGVGACQQAAVSVQCANASCTGSTFTPAAFCSGSGTCANPVTSSCGAYVCGGNTCKNTCASDSDCTGGNYCTGASGSCLAKKAAGASCGSSHECVTGNCTDGVCCTTATCSTCQACNLSGNGTCATVANGNLEPHGLCPTSTTCANTGLCSAGACQQASTSVQCGNPSCSGTTYTPPAFCSGSGACSTPATQSCGAYVCGATACKFLCASDNDCSSGNYCTGPNGSCVVKKSAGAICTADNQCGTGHCTDGVCCAVSACGTCQACNLSGTGTCATVANGNPEPNGLCPTSTTCGNTGLCSAGVCQQASTAVQCGNASCTGSTLTPAAFCSGSGTCASPGTVSCGAYVCGTNACKATCASDSDCTTGNYCTGTNGSCVAKKAPGNACTADNQCGTGHCTDGVCCSVSACGTCQACNLSGTGTCAAVANGNPEPNGLCPASPPCGNTGLCSGGACQQASVSVMCSAAFCSTSTFQPAGFCSGAGSCTVPGTTSCSPYTCTASGCKVTCSVDADCVSGDYCTGAGGSCLPKRTNGMTCSGDNQCSSAHCTEGYCCGSSVCPSCQSCAVAGLQGTCSNVTAGGADPTGTCVDQGAASCQKDGKCDGAGSCRLYSAATVCLASCAVDQSVLTSTYCDGLGTCGPATVPTTCPTNVCIAGPPSTCQ